jgi:hypothetical protein
MLVAEYRSNDALGCAPSGPENLCNTVSLPAESTAKTIPQPFTP